MRFTYNTEGIAVALWYNGIEYYYVRNLQNDVIGLLNSDGEWVVEYSYDAWGNILNISGSLAATVGQNNPLRYRGQYYDNETGLYYLVNRYYSPVLKRFINADVFAGTTGALGSHNLFTYCMNNPVNCTDDMGDFWDELKSFAKKVVNKVTSTVSSAIRSVGNAISNMGVTVKNTVYEKVVPFFFGTYTRNVSVKNNFSANLNENSNVSYNGNYNSGVFQSAGLSFAMQMVDGMNAEISFDRASGAIEMSGSYDLGVSSHTFAISVERTAIEFSYEREYDFGIACLNVRDAVKFDYRRVLMATAVVAVAAAAVYLVGGPAVLVSGAVKVLTAGATFLSGLGAGIASLGAAFAW